MRRITSPGYRRLKSKWLSILLIEAVTRAAKLLHRNHAPRDAWSSRNGEPIVALIGPFNYRNWVDAYVRPIVESNHALRVVVFSKRAFDLGPQVRTIVAPRLLRKLSGPSIARHLVFLAWCVRYRPCMVVALHLTTSGFVGLVAARIAGAKAAYYCVGGRSEIADGGLGSESQLLSSIGEPNAYLERKLVQVANSFDVVLTMGTRTTAQLRELGVSKKMYPIAVGVDTRRFCATHAARAPVFDVVTVARLVEVKRLDRFLAALCLLRSRGRDVTAVIVGDGPEREKLEEKARHLGITASIRFVGAQDHVERWLLNARLFALTSESEGLPIAMIEALSCGAGVVVPAVGDIEDAINDERIGLAVREGTPAAYADAIDRMLDLDADQQEFLRELRRTQARAYSVEERARLWRAILEDLFISERCRIHS